MPLKIYKLTKTLDSYEKDLIFTDKKEDANILLVGCKPFSLVEFPKLKGIFKVGIGTDNIPFDECKILGVSVGLPSEDTRDFIYDETANFTCYLIFKMHYINIDSIDGWIKNERGSLGNMKLLILGKGNIGKRVYHKMKIFMDIDYYDCMEHKEKDLNNKLKDCDIVSIHIPLIETNKNFMNKERLKLLRSGSIIINTARGKIVNENALYEEIKSGRLRAAFDVFWKEPYSGKLKEFYPDRFFMTPHVASMSKEFTKGLSNDFRNFLEGINND